MKAVGKIRNICCYATNTILEDEGAENVPTQAVGGRKEDQAFFPV